MAQGRSPAAKGPLDGRMATSLRSLTDRIRSLENRIILSTKLWRIEDSAIGELTAFNPTTGVTTILAPETDTGGTTSVTSLGESGGLSPNAWFGDGRDGDHIVSGTEVMTSSKSYQNLTVPVGCVLVTNAFIVTVNGILSGSGRIIANGNDAVGPARGEQISLGNLRGLRGGNGSVFGGVGGNGQGVAAGGHGGDGNGFTGGVGGPSFAPSEFGFGMGIAGDIVYFVAEYNDGGSGGGGGGGDGTYSGGGGGSGATGVWLAVYDCQFTGSVECNGGKGADGDSAGDTGGGGGGSGGNLVFIAGSAEGAARPTITSNGGLPGNGAGAGHSGLPGEKGILHVYWYTGSGDLAAITGGVGGVDGEHNGLGSDTTQVGRGATANGAQTVVIGVHAQDALDGTSYRSVVIGREATLASGAYGSVIVGRGARGADHDATIMGSDAYTDASGGVAIGSGAAADTSVSVNATAVGYGATARGASAVAVGDDAFSGADHAVAVGEASAVSGAGDVGVGYGSATNAGGDAVALGRFAFGKYLRSIAIGATSETKADDTSLIKADSLEVESSSGVGLETSLILTDSSGARWGITVDTTGHLTTTAL